MVEAMVEQLVDILYLVDLANHDLYAQVSVVRFVILLYMNQASNANQDCILCKSQLDCYFDMHDAPHKLPRLRPQ
jgi:hypothetical protein